MMKKVSIVLCFGMLLSGFSKLVDLMLVGCLLERAAIL
jgi:hypothetical protein